MTTTEQLAEWKRKRAEKYVCTQFPNALEVTHAETFQAGIDAAMELGRALGRLDELNEIAPHVEDSEKYIKRSKQEAAATVARLMGE